MSLDFPRGFPLTPRASGGGGVAESRKSVDVSGNTSRWFTLTRLFISRLTCDVNDATFANVGD
jgi:hypothetical protein